MCIHPAQYQFLIKPQKVSDEVCKDVFGFLKGGETIYYLDYVKVLRHTGEKKWSSIELVHCFHQGCDEDCGCIKSKTTVTYAEGAFTIYKNGSDPTTIKSPRDVNWNSLRLKKPG